MIGMLPAPRLARIAVYAISRSLAQPSRCLAALAPHQDASERETLTLRWPTLGSARIFRSTRFRPDFWFIVGVAGSSPALRDRLRRYEAEPHRILPFYPAFIAGMLPGAARRRVFTFLFAWELMVARLLGAGGLASPRGRYRHAGILYLIMARSAPWHLLLAVGLLAGPYGTTRSMQSAPMPRTR